MHNQILGTPQRLEGDHVDGDGLNNQRGNLRVATAAQNRRNQPPQLRHGRRYKGITLDKRTGKWIAQITYAGKTHYIGTYSTDVEAAKAYNEAAIGTFADFAWLNPV